VRSLIVARLARFRGRSEVEPYWRAKLASEATDALRSTR